MATNPDLTYPSDSNSGLLIACHGSESDAKTCANFFGMKEKRIAEQLTRLDTVFYILKNSRNYDNATENLWFISKNVLIGIEWMKLPNWLAFH